MRCRDKRALEARMELLKLPTVIGDDTSLTGRNVERATDEQLCRIYARAQRAMFSRKPSGGR